MGSVVVTPGDTTRSRERRMVVGDSLVFNVIQPRWSRALQFPDIDERLRRRRGVELELETRIVAAWDKVSRLVLVKTAKFL